MPMEMRSTDRIVLAGLPGTGKTTLGKYLASICEPNILIYDPLAQYDSFPDECRYIPKSDSLQEFDGICRRLRSRRNCLFFVEEAERYLGQGKPLGENAFDLINRSRNWGVGICAITRRIQRLSKDFFDLAQHAFLFKCGLKSRGYIADLIGWEDTKKVMSLPMYHFLHYNVEDESATVHVLKLSGGAGQVETKEEVDQKRAEEENVRGGRVEEKAPEQPREEERDAKVAKEQDE